MSEEAPVSLAGQVRIERARRQHSETIDLQIPGYRPDLWVTFRALEDYTEIRRILKRHETVRDEAQREMNIAADTLVAAGVDCFAIVDGERVPLGVSLGLGLAGYIGLEGAENDRQAVFMLFDGNTVALMTLFGELQQFFASTGEVTDSELVGESVAPS